MSKTKADIFPFSIIQDTREKHPWRLDWYKQCKSQIIRGLSTGDYTVEGYEDLICIERKRSTGELCTNLGTEADRFYKELERMSAFEYKFIVCEFPISNLDIFPKNSGIPKYMWKKLHMNGKFIKKRLIEWANFFDIELVFCLDMIIAQTATINIITDILKGNNYYHDFDGQAGYEIFRGD